MLQPLVANLRLGGDAARRLRLRNPLSSSRTFRPPPLPEGLFLIVEVLHAKARKISRLFLKNAVSSGLSENATMVKLKPQTPLKQSDLSLSLYPKQEKK